MTQDSSVSDSERRRTVTVNSGGVFKIWDSVGTGVFDTVSHRRGAIVNYGGTVTIMGGTIIRSTENGTNAAQRPGCVNGGSNSWYVIDNQGAMTMNGGTLVNTGYFSSLIHNLGTTYDAKFTMNKGMLQNGFIALKNDDNGVIEINGGIITTTSSFRSSLQNWEKGKVNGGILKVQSWHSHGTMRTIVS